MKTVAAVLYEINKPLCIEQIEIPRLKPGQVLVKLAFSGVCHSQLMEIHGRRGPDKFLPHLLGHEGSGIVMETGEEVGKVAVGDSVALTWIKSSGADSGGTQYSGNNGIINAGGITTFSKHSVVSENRCVKIPSNFPLDIAALLGCAVLTGAGMVMNTMRPNDRNSIIIWGVGGIGLSAVMGAKLSNCKSIIAIDNQDFKLEMAQIFGATHIINAKSIDVQTRICEIVGKEGVDFAVESAGRTDTIEQAFRAVRKKGGLCVFASHPATDERICLDPYDLISGKQIKGSWGGESFPDRDIPRFVDYFTNGMMPLEKLATHRYKLDMINNALNDLESGEVGRPIIEM